MYPSTACGSKGEHGKSERNHTGGRQDPQARARTMGVPRTRAATRAAAEEDTPGRHGERNERRDHRDGEERSRRRDRDADFAKIVAQEGLSVVVYLLWPRRLSTASSSHAVMDKDGLDPASAPRVADRGTLGAGVRCKADGRSQGRAGVWGERARRRVSRSHQLADSPQSDLPTRPRTHLNSRFSKDDQVQCQKRTSQGDLKQVSALEKPA